MTIVQMENAPSQTWEGIYDPPEAARYIRASRNADNVYALDSTKLRRWIRRGLSNPDRTKFGGRNLLINFDELISMRVCQPTWTAGTGSVERTAAAFPRSYFRYRYLHGQLVGTDGRYRPGTGNPVWSPVHKGHAHPGADDWRHGRRG